MLFKYIRRELLLRWTRTVLTALGLAIGVGLVMSIMGVANGLSNTQQQVLSPLSSVGTDIIVTRTVGAVTTDSTTTTNPFSQGAGGGGFGGGGGFARGGGGGFFRNGGKAPNGTSLQSLNSTDASALLQANSSVLTDLAKLGPPGTKFTYDFFVPGTLITFPQVATSIVSKINGVSQAVPGISLQALHETGTVPQITDTYTTGGQSLSVTATPPPLTSAQRAQLRSCLQSQGLTFKQFRQGLNSGTSSSTSPTSPTGNSGSVPPASSGTTSSPSFSQSFLNCLPASYQQYEANVVVPEQTITRVLNPPTTNTQTSSYTVAGVDPNNTTSGLITTNQLIKGTWFTSNPTNELLVDSAYANTNKITLGQSLTIDKQTFKVVGIVNPSLTGDTSDLYFDLQTLQSMSSNSNRINEILVKVNNASEVNSVAAAIKKQLPGAQVLTAASLADQVSGSLSNAHTLASTLGTALAIIVLLASFLITTLLTLSSINKRTREIGTLRAIGWKKSRVLLQIMMETIGIGIVGLILGLLVGYGISGIIGAVGPTLSSTINGLSVGASSVGQLFHQTNSASSTIHVKVTAPISIGVILVGIASAIAGALIAGLFGGMRAIRLLPAEALRDLG